ncbi:LuxR C-terminal-related transcriptional regulator [Antrihabitans spumae]|uniref:LuxR C-terminal-related transcriptional regulator n=1 Tax=Antrihabitans spumae TaxID=3373370 RepID=A0ABW7KJ70_9NOCA
MIEQLENPNTEGPCEHCPFAGRVPAPVPLSTREKEVLRTWLFADTKTQAAGQLFITMGTVNTHISRIRTKYAEAGRSASTKSALLARALQDGIVFLIEL